MLAQFEAFQKQSADKTHSKDIVNSYTLRSEQRAAVEQTIAYHTQALANPDLSPKFLWNAKPRFGKTLAAYTFAAKIRAHSILIVTNRPTVADSWYTDFQKFSFQDSEQNSTSEGYRWIFTSSEAVKRRLGNPEDIYTREQQLAQSDLLQCDFIHFISLQDIKGQDISGFKQKNGWIFNYGEGNYDASWDLIIIDESHEGVDTDKSFQVFEQIRNKFTLHLSGTPFRALADQRFLENQIYSWSYVDEQRKKSQDHSGVYDDLPKMYVCTYQLSRILEDDRPEAEPQSDEYFYNPSELFRVVKTERGDAFLYEDAVRNFIKNLSNPERSYPFSNQVFRNHLRHTFWLLPGVKACEQFKRLLLKDQYFKTHYSPENIILAAGSGDADRLTNTALAEVRLRIGDPLSTRTITLSCGQLTTGVTIPEWTGVFILCNCQSSSLYIQSAFRAQNPCSIEISPSERLVKTNCFIFDFVPDQTLRTIAKIAKASNPSASAPARERQIRELLRYLPVATDDEEKKLHYLDAQEVINTPLRLASAEVLMRKFMSNRLFRNINHIFGAPPEVIKIINKIQAHRRRNRSPVSSHPRIWLDRNKVIHINEDIIIPTGDGFMGERQYVELGTREAEEVSSIINIAVRQARAAKYSPVAIRLIKDSLTKKLPQLVVQLPTPASQDYQKDPPDSPPAVNSQSEEEKVRESLRNFARSVPTLLMAYGNQDTTLANFDQLTTDDIFVALTGITKAEFRILRDGVEYRTHDERGRATTTHSGSFFDETIFNAAIQSFIVKREEVANYYQHLSTADIFEYIASQAAHQIFTPRNVVKKSINQLIAHDPEIFKSTTNTFLDPYMKSGAYIAEVAKQLFRHTRKSYASDEECIKHILEQQVYGLTPTKVLQDLSQSYLFGFDTNREISRHHFQEFDITAAAKFQELAATINTIFIHEGEKMKFTAIIGNPPYMEVGSKTTSQTQSNSNWIYQHFQNGAEQIAQLTCLIYPFGGWFDSPNRLGGFGKKLLSDGHTVSIDAYESTSDHRAWYRSDRKPQPVFGNDANLSAGVAIVLRDLQNHYDSFWYANRIYTDQRVTVRIDRTDLIPPNPAFHQINQKLYGPKLCQRIQKNLFGIESHFAASHPHQISDNPQDWRQPVRLLTNDKAGSAGRAQYYWVDRKNIPKGAEYLDKYKVVTTAAYPKKTFVASSPTLENVKKRLHDLIEILPSGSAFGRSRLALFMSDDERECRNFLRYTQTNFFAALLLQEPNRRSSFGDIIPDQDFSVTSDIDWNRNLSDIDQQLCQKYRLTKSERAFLGI